MSIPPPPPHSLHPDAIMSVLDHCNNFAWFVFDSYGMVVVVREMDGYCSAVHCGRTNGSWLDWEVAERIESTIPLD